ncbi:hypothetical protein [Arcanobacterium hippocoleae]|uniref:TPM domain-containing protein n=1 Tax=Arcanobacterium hippocoleae TaxID=149017 RepID=A0ABU1SZQ4_9ACTO|nr:hypothetical protein [Arcanobacterium hippocoleae]MDR6938531.1 hypothetical protein [Arcanobacterium hippocoleae]
MKLRKVAQLATASICTLTLSFTVVGVANATEAQHSTTVASQLHNAEWDSSLTESEIEEFADATADSFVVLFRDVIKHDGAKFVIDERLAAEYGFGGSSEQLTLIVNSLNGASDNPYVDAHSDRSWGSFGSCVVTGVLGFSPFQIDYNLFGKYIYEKSWNKVADLLKRYAKKEITKKGGDIVLKQIIKSTPAGFAAWLGVYAVGCAAKEAWNWWRA